MLIALAIIVLMIICYAVYKIFSAIIKKDWKRVGYSIAGLVLSLGTIFWGLTFLISSM